MAVKRFHKGEIVDESTQRRDNEEYYSDSGAGIERIFPIDDYEIDSRLCNHATRYHFIKVLSPIPIP